MTGHIDRAEVTTERVRSKFATVLDDTSGWKYDSEWGRDFDRWLTAHDAAVAARALREFGPEMQEEFACDPEVECPEGTCTNCDLLFAVQSTAAERADRIEREGGDDV